MAGIVASSGSSGRKPLDHQIPLVPFIDFLLCLVSFLLITAVWSQTARVTAEARVPSQQNPSCCVEEPKKTLHVVVGPEQAQLVWRKGSAVLDSVSVALKPEGGEGSLRYPALGEAVARQWQSNESRHFADGDLQVDPAVLHANNAIPFADLVALIDAISAPKRDWRAPDGNLTQRSAFAVSLATD